MMEKIDTWTTQSGEEIGVFVDNGVLQLRPEIDAKAPGGANGDPHVELDRAVSTELGEVLGYDFARA